MKPEEITKLLDSYIEWEKPDYAIMLTGGWGTGKTHFIKDYIAKSRHSAGNKKKLIYLSLYGMASESEVERQLWFQISKPIFARIIKWIKDNLSSCILLGFLLLCILVASVCDYGLAPLLFLLRIVETISVAGITLWIYDTLKMSFLQKTLSNIGVIVFDDFERANMPLNQLLAYINRYVEHLNKHVVIVCNKEEIKEDDSSETKDPTTFAKQNTQSSVDKEKEEKAVSCSSFQKIKEKVIGKEIVLEQDKAGILQHLWMNGNFPRLNKAISQKGLGVEWFVSVSTPQTAPVNYRVWKRCCRDYEDTFIGIEESVICHPEVAQRLITFFFPVCYGIQIHDFGNKQLFPQKDIRELYCLLFDQKHPMQWFLEMFPYYHSSYSNVLDNLWNEILFKSRIETQKMQSYLEKIVKEEESFFPMLHHYFQYDDIAMDKAWSDLTNAFRNHSITDPNEIADIVVCILDMISSQCCPDSSLTPREIVVLTRLYCKNLSFSIENESSFSSSSFFSMYSFRVQDNHRDVIKKILNYLDSKVTFYIKSVLVPERYQKLLRALHGDKEFRNLWYGENLRLNNIFSNQDPNLLVDALIQSPVSALRTYVLQVVDNLTDVPFSAEHSLPYYEFKKSFIESLQNTLNNPNLHLHRTQKYYFRIAINNLSLNLKEIDDREKTDNKPTPSADKEPEQ